MKKTAAFSAVVLLAPMMAVMLAPACGGSSPTSGFNSGPGGGNNGSGDDGGSASDDGGGHSLGNGNGNGNGNGGSEGGGGVACVAGAQCNVTCSGSGTTTITGTVMDPAGSDPLYNVVAYVPSGTVEALPLGVPTGAGSCSCSALFTGNPINVATTDVNGNFTISNAPVGKNIPLVIQVGKWRKQLTVTTTACAAASAGTITLPKNSSEGDLPDIAVSTGGADSLECLLVRVGIDPKEYVPGWTQPGHVHIFNGGLLLTETNPMVGAPGSSAALWDSVPDLMKNDIVLLSCEGSQTAGAIPDNLETYLNQGGRAFASHFHYAWFTGWLGYTAPTDWGDNLADWSLISGGGSEVGGIIQTTLTGGGPFPKGIAMQQWLSNLKALPGDPSNSPAIPAGELTVVAPRYAASVTNQAPSQSWIQADTATDSNASSAPTLFFSFDTPVGEAAGPDGGPPQYCGRAVFSGLHVGGASFDGVNCGGAQASQQGCNTGHVAAAPPPAGCDTTHPLSPQEKALEFMLFNLSSCVVPDTVAPQNDAGVPYIPR